MGRPLERSGGKVANGKKNCHLKQEKMEQKSV